ncbi:MAG: hypothetical protein J6P73_07685, partial [Bacteroidales bacterium]|nr:hypothetical protein [Bacteroidales bacterium]
LGLRYDSLVPYRAAAPSRRGRPTFASYAGLKLSKNFRPTPRLPFPQGRKRLQRYNLFPYWQAFSQLFFKKFSPG